MEAKEVLSYINSNAAIKADFEYLCNSIHSLTKLQWGANGAGGAVDSKLPVNNPLQLIDIFLTLVDNKYRTVESNANWIIYNLMNLNFIDALCKKLDGMVIANHSISSIGPKYSVAYVWFEDEKLKTSFVLWGLDKKAAWSDRIRFLIIFRTLSNYIGGISTATTTHFQIKAVSATTQHTKSDSKACWDSQILKTIETLANDVLK